MGNIEYSRNGTITTNDFTRRLNKPNYTTTNKPNYTKIQEENRKEMNTENTNERLNILDVINRISNKIDLSETQKNENRKAIEKAKDDGITAVGHFNCEMRTLLNGNGITSTQRAETKSSEMDDNLLSMVTFYPNLKANLKVPYFDENTCQWKEEGYSISENTDTLTSKYLTPHRLTTKIDFSVSILRQSGKFYEEVNDILIKAIYNKLVETILSDDAETTDQPKGIFNGVSANTISTIADLATLQYNGDKQKTNNIWVISPKAKAEILKLNPSLFNDGKFLGSPYISENRMNDGLIAYLPLDLVVVAQFGAVQITVDNVTDVVNGNVKTYIETYFDFDFLDDTKIQLGIFS